MLSRIDYNRRPFFRSRSDSAALSRHLGIMSADTTNGLISTETFGNGGGEPSIAPGSTRIVVIDDNVEVARVVALCLQKSGFPTSTVNTPIEGLRLVFSLNPALVISDMMMAGISGADIVHCIRTSDRTQHIPVLIMSASGDADTASIGDAFLQKPFKIAELLALVRRLTSAETLKA